MPIKIKSNPLVSVIIPVYNEEKYLSHCLYSLNKQTYKNIEIIIVDDGSTDKSVEIASKLDLVLIKQNHKGSGTARNLGAKRAKGKILLFLDADMKYDAKHIKKLIQPIIREGAVGTFSREEYVANPQNIWSRCWSINSGLPITRRIAKNAPKRLGVYRAILKEKFIQTGGFDSSKGYFDDGTLETKLGQKAIFAPGAISYHYNPETLKEVYLSSRWIGRSGKFKRNLENMLRFSILNSSRISFNKTLRGAPLLFFIFKIIYDLGMFSGIFLSNKKVEK